MDSGLISFLAHCYTNAIDFIVRHTFLLLASDHKKAKERKKDLLDIFFVLLRNRKFIECGKTQAQNACPLTFDKSQRNN